jgi:hypothetical protein
MARSSEVLREQGRRGGLKDGERRRAKIAQRIAGMTPLKIYRYGYQAGYRAGLRPAKGDARCEGIE